MRKRLLLLSILLLAALPRLIQIDARPVGRHAWRQSDTASVARNYYQSGYRFLYPQIDWEIPGYVEMEFPVYPWTVALAYGVTGENEAVPRLLSVVGSILATLFLYLLVARILGHRAASWAAFFFALTPLSLFLGRAIMPEAWVLAATAAGIYWFLRWTEEDSWLYFVLSALATALACLLKLTSLYMGLPLLWLAWQRFGNRTLIRWPVWFYGAMVVAPLAAWYSHAYRLGQQFGASFHIFTAAGTDKWGRWDLLLSLDFYNHVFLGNLGGRILTWVGLLVFVVGLFLSRRTRLERLFDVWLLAAVIVIFLASGGAYAHDYYSLPLLLPAAAFMGKVFDRGWERGKLVLVVATILILVLSLYRYVGHLMDERDPNQDVEIARLLAERTSEGDLVISCNEANPIWLYLAGRRGWGRFCSEMDKERLHELIEKGARVLVAQATDLEEAQTSRFTNYLHTFYSVKEIDEVVFVDLTAPQNVAASDWQAIWGESFDGAGLPEGWHFDSSHWQIEGGSLVGSRARKTVSALASPAFAGCDICRVEAQLEVVRPQPRRASPRATLKAWRGAAGTHVAVTLGTEENMIWFQQHQDGKLKSATKIPTPLESGRVYSVEIRFDLYDFELLLDGKSLATLPSRFSSTPFGTVGVQTRAAKIKIDDLRVSAAARLPN